MVSGLVFSAPSVTVAQILSPGKSTRAETENSSNDLDGLRRDGTLDSLKDAFRKVSGKELNETDSPSLLPGGNYEQSEVLASDGAAGNSFGYSVAVSGDTAVVGQIGDTKGAAHVFVRNGTTWSHQQKLTAANGATGDHFGYHVSIWEDTIAVGSVYDDIPLGNDGGSVHVFVRAAGTWSLQAFLTASDAGPSQFFGHSVSLQNDRLVVGATGANSSRGAVYVVERSAGVWTEKVKLQGSDSANNDKFGFNVALSGNSMVVGAPSHNSNRGAAYVFSGSGASWTQDAKLVALGSAVGDLLGVRVTINDDTIAVGAPEASGGRGFVLVYKRTAGIWNLEQRIESPVNSTTYFGTVSVFGDRLAVGAPYAANSIGAAVNGSVYVFTRTDGVWNLQRRLTPSDPQDLDYFGYSVALSAETVAVGAPFRSTYAGAAYMHLWGPVLATAGGSNFSGRILDTNGRGLSNATVVLTDSSGVERTVQTGSFGRFSFADLPSGESYVVDVRSKRFRFSPQVVNLTSDLDSFTMTASERRR